MVLLIAAFLYFILPISVPLILAFVTAIILNPMILWLMKRTNYKMGRGVAVTLVFVVSVLIVAVASFVIITKATTQVISFTESVPGYLSAINERYDDWEQDFKAYSDNIPNEIIVQITDSINGMLDTVFTWVREMFTIENIASIFAKVPDLFVASIVYMMALYLFMLEMPKLKQSFYSAMTDKTAEKIKFVNGKTFDVVMGYFIAHLKCSLIILVSSFIGLLIIKPEMALIMSIVIWVADLLPVVGSSLVLIPWAAIAFFSGDVSLGIALSILTIILLVVRRVTEPKIMSNQIGISPLAALISMFIGYKIIGFLGFIVGPLVVMMYASLKESGLIQFKIKI